MNTTKDVVKILNKFQRNIWRFDICRLTFSKLFDLLSEQQTMVLLQLCELTKKEALSLDQTIPAQNQLVNPYPYRTYARRFVRVTPELRDAFRSLAKEIQKNNGQRLRIGSGYRSPAYQSMLFLGELYRCQFDMAAAKRLVQLPGQSEHQMISGLAIDLILGKKGAIDQSTYTYLQKHAGRYGFTNSYPKNNSQMDFEAWHWKFSKVLTR